MGKYSTLSEAINDLSQNGYTHDFNNTSPDIEFVENKLELQPDEFEIDRVYRFQEMSDVDNESILYAISSKNGSVKGLLVDAYGIYADSTTTKLISKLTC